MDYLQELNDEQRKAVEHKEGPLMIVAGAGSGKTRVLIYRIAHLINSGVDAFNILALTFTNKAAREMQKRIEQVAGAEAKNLWMGTFHAVFARILRYEAGKLGYTGNYTIYDTSDTKSLIKAIVKEQGLDEKLYKSSAVYNRISLAKNNFISVRQYLDDPEIQSQDIASGRPKIGIVYEQYSKRCFKSDAMDFDDLLINTYRLFDNHPDVLNKYQHKFRHILVDEYQDTNFIQYLIIKKLAAVNRNICVVGDDFQSIYAFRGANIKNILNFEKDYPELKVYKLEQNYRSTKNIVNAAGEIIRNNKHQLKKELWTSNDEGNKIKLIKAFTDNEEGMLVGRSIFQEQMEYKRKPGEFAILYRTNAQSRSFEEALRKLNIPYRIIGGLSFYQRKEIKDMLAYCRLVINPKDEEAFKRVINYPARGIGKTTLESIVTLASDHDLSLWKVAENIDDFPFSSRVKTKIMEFVTMIKSLMVESENKNAYDLTIQAAKSSGISHLLYEDKTQEGINRYENLQELLGAVKAFTETTDNEDKSLASFMQEVALLTDADSKSDSDDAVTLMTIHSAKGLEFPCIYITGMEENLFPSQMALQSRDDLEEERRLFYVALTRGEQNVTLSYAKSRYRWGNVVPCEPSRFIDEINPKYLDVDIPSQGFNSQLQSNINKNIENFYSNKNKPKSPVNIVQKNNNIKADPNFKAEQINDLKNGMEVEHNKFGIGKVLNVDGNGTNLKATIYFSEHGQKQILIKYAKMKIHKNN